MEEDTRKPLVFPRVSRDGAIQS